MFFSLLSRSSELIVIFLFYVAWHLQLISYNFERVFQWPLTDLKSCYFHMCYAVFHFILFLISGVIVFYETSVSLFFPRATAVAVAAFLDAFQKVADLATNSRGRNMCTDVEDWEHNEWFPQATPFSSLNIIGIHFWWAPVVAQSWRGLNL